MTADAPVFEAAVPILSVEDLPAALDFYQRVLGFQTGWTWGEPTYLASICRDHVELNIGARGKAGPPGTSKAYIQMRGIDTYYEQVRAAGATIPVPLAARVYGMKDFNVRDPSGNEISFGEATAA
jgi:uncharacterized glyoxalase superfamily protein PhnB